MENRFDRSAEDLGNIVALEHVNLRNNDQRLVTLFYVMGLGLTRDPYLVTGVANMWINIGRSQVHLPTNVKAQVLRGRVGLVVPDLDFVEESLKGVTEMLADTEFSFKRHGDYIDAVCPWGNQFRCHAPSEANAPVQLGMVYVELNVPPGTADGIARFYKDIFYAPAHVDTASGSPAARVLVGQCQELIYRETDADIPDYDGHHIQVYVSNFSGPHERLAERGLITEESNQHQYRFVDIVDPDSGALLTKLEHEVRSMTNPLYARPLVNRNPKQTNNAYQPGHHETPWSMPG